MGLYLSGLYAFMMFIFFIFSAISFDRYLFKRNYGVLSYLAILFYFAIIPVTHSVFTVGASAVVMKAFHGTIPFSWSLPIFCYLGAIILASTPQGLLQQSKGLTIWLIIVPIILICIGIMIATNDPWWNGQISRNIHSSIPSIGMIMVVSNVSFLISTIIMLFIRSRKDKQLRIGEI